jgi:hypothetical protein
VNDGRTVPIRFTLTQHSFDPIGTPEALTQQVDCATLAPVGPLEEAHGSWRQDDGPRYRFDWKTRKNWEGRCFQFVLRIGNIVDPVAYFRFH